jgi:hypothetical protein
MNDMISKKATLLLIPPLPLVEEANKDEKPKATDIIKL